MKNISTRYDNVIQRWAGIYLADAMDWRILKAQLWQESRFNPTAVSPVGAKGIGQFMPPTWSEVSQELGFPVNANPFDPVLNTQAAAYYMSKQIRAWSSPRPEADRICLALASYNAGFGNMLKAQVLAGGALDYKSIIEKLPEVTGDKSAETINYVVSIWRTYIRLVTG